MKIDILVIGDINLDHHVKETLSYKFTDLQENGVIIWEDIEDIPGGSGLNMCRFAHEMGYSTFLLGSVGDDTAGKFIYDWLKDRSIHFHQNLMLSYSKTGKALIMRDNKGIRLLINNVKNANDLLNIDTVKECESIIANSKILYISGYSLNQNDAPRFVATQKAMNIAKSSQSSPIIVFDVVPHRVHEKYSLKQFINLTSGVDILITEVSTIRRFLKLGYAGEIISKEIVYETLEGIKPYYSRLLLRYGPSGCDEQVLYDSTIDLVEFQSTGHDLLTDKRGLGDKLALLAFRDFFKILVD